MKSLFWKLKITDWWTETSVSSIICHTFRHLLWIKWKIQINRYFFMTNDKMRITAIECNYGLPYDKNYLEVRLVLQLDLYYPKIIELCSLWNWLNHFLFNIFGRYTSRSQVFVWRPNYKWIQNINKLLLKKFNSKLYFKLLRKKFSLKLQLFCPFSKLGGPKIFCSRVALWPMA